MVGLIKDTWVSLLIVGIIVVLLGGFYYINNQIPPSLKFRVVQNTYLSGKTYYVLQGCWRSDCLFGQYTDFGSYDNESTAIYAKEVGTHYIDSVTISKQEVIK